MMEDCQQFLQNSSYQLFQFFCVSDFIQLPALENSLRCYFRQTIPTPKLITRSQAESINMFGSHMSSDVTGDGPKSVDSHVDMPYDCQFHDTENTFIVDLASNRRFIRNLSLLIKNSLKLFATPWSIMSSGGTTKAVGTADILFKHLKTGFVEKLSVWFAPDFPVNLLAQRKYCDDNNLFILE